jgi:alanyl-tRNA synthetase
VAGPAALALLKKDDMQLKEIAKAIGSDVDKLQTNMARHVQELERAKKDYSALLERLGASIANEIISSKKGTHSILMLPYPREFLRKVATLAVEKEKGIAVMLHNSDGDIVCISGSDSKTNALDFAKAHVKEIDSKADFVGGGSRRIAEGKLTTKK